MKMQNNKLNTDISGLRQHYQTFEKAANGEADSQAVSMRKQPANGMTDVR